LFVFFGSKIAICLSSDLHKDAHAQATGNLQLSKENIKHENSLLFSIFVGHFALLDPDPATQINADPDPQPWFLQLSNGVKLE
jgi:hypothetical protein